MENTCKLLNTSEEEYGNLHKAHILDQYKLYVEMMDRVSQRRLLANTFFISANSALATLFSFVKATNNNGFALMSIIGFIICASWFCIIKSYRQLNTGKFDVIHKLEKFLPLSIYEYEWNILEQGKSKDKYWPLSHLESYIPFAFAFIYIILIFLR